MRAPIIRAKKQKILDILIRRNSAPKGKINRNTNVQNSQEQNTEEQRQVGATIGGLATIGAIGGAVYCARKRK